MSSSGGISAAMMARGSTGALAVALDEVDMSVDDLFPQKGGD